MLFRLLAAFGSFALIISPASAEEPEKIRALIIDGQNNHGVWPKSTIMMRDYLEETGLFEVDFARTRPVWKAEREADYLPLTHTGAAQQLPEPVTDPDFAPVFSDYDVVISNFGWRAADWPAQTRAAFEAFVASGGGFVSVHAADNSFPDWPEYNLMIGLGGWGGRDERSGPYVYYDNDGNLIRDTSPGPAGAHGPRHVFPVTIREPDHPITRGMPPVWLASEDECYAKLRGPALNMTILATCKDQSADAPTDRHEPAMMVLDYGEGRVFHLALGHDETAFEGVGLITALTRGTEWAATGEVTQAIPADFPTAEAEMRRPYADPEWTVLLDPQLSHWEEWTGVVPENPDANTIPEFTRGTPVGLGDPYNLFSYGESEDGAPFLYVSGQYYGALSSLETYTDYHLTMEFLWGETKHAPRLDRLRDSGILYHCYGEHGDFWQVWKRCAEMQVQETDMGDLFLLAGPRAMVRFNEEKFWDAAQEPALATTRIRRSVDKESPRGHWTRLDLYVLGDQAIHVVNGEVVLAIDDASEADGKPLVRGHIQLQSEGAEAYYRDVRIRPINALPDNLRKAAALP